MSPSVTIKSVWVWLLIVVCCWVLMGCSAAGPAVPATPSPEPTPTVQVATSLDGPDLPHLRRLPAKMLLLKSQYGERS